MADTVDLSGLLAKRDQLLAEVKAERALRREAEAKAAGVAGLISKNEKLLAEAKAAKSAKRDAEAELATARRAIDLLRASIAKISPAQRAPGRAWTTRLKGA